MVLQILIPLAYVGILYGLVAGWFFFIFNYIGIWALANWGWIDIAWHDNFLNLMTKWITKNFISDAITGILAVPFEQTRFILQGVDPTDAGYHFLFVLTAYPILYMGTMQVDINNLIFIPFLAFLYLLTPAMFVDSVRTTKIGEEYQVPEKGLPTWWAQWYAINAICWGNYDYLDFKKPLDVSFI